jgi:hypothetical protein
MVIQVDSREKAKAIRKILAEFDKQGIKHPVSKLFVGDYQNFDNPRLVVDRKQNLSEVCSNVCQDHERFRRELQRANENEIKVVFLVEHGADVRELEDVIFWDNPRKSKSPKAMNGETLYRILSTIERKYDTKFVFCTKEETGKKIIEILSGDST